MNLNLPNYPILETDSYTTYPDTNYPVENLKLSDHFKVLAFRLLILYGTVEKAGKAIGLTRSTMYRRLWNNGVNFKLAIGIHKQHNIATQRGIIFKQGNKYCICHKKEL